MQEFFKLTISERAEFFRTGDPNWALLEEKLLDMGGTLLVPMPDPDTAKLVKRGKVYKYYTLEMNEGMDSACHVNTALLYLLKSSKGFKIVTGYALSEDGYWRQHSWGSMGKKIIETTVPRVKYFGFKLNSKESSMAVDAALEIRRFIKLS
jgi:hypothetical protein